MECFFRFVGTVIILPFALAVWYICDAIDKASKAICRIPCAFGCHKPVDRGPHRQGCLHCEKHFDIDLMATDLNVGRIGFMQQDIRLGTVGRVDELLWDFEVTGGDANLLLVALLMYDAMCASYRGGPSPLANLP